MSNGFKVISGSSNLPLAEDIKDWIKYKTGNNNFELVDCTLGQFSDGETQVQINENLRGYHVFVIQSLCYPTNDNLIELSLILDSLRRSDVSNITVILPYYGYGRQDKKDKPRVPISASVVSQIIQLSKPDRVVTIDLHASQIQGFFDCPVDNLYASMVFLDHVKKFTNGTVCISPDSGGTERVTYYANQLGCEMGFCYKHREQANKISNMKLVGEVKGKDCLILDDLCDTAGTLCKASDILIEEGAKSVSVFFTHPVLSGKGIQRLTENKNISNIFTTDTIPPRDEMLKNNKFQIVSVGTLLGDVILRLANGHSLSKMFK